jgi:hypothetical protein
MPESKLFENDLRVNVTTVGLVRLDTSRASVLLSLSDRKIRTGMVLPLLA